MNSLPDEIRYTLLSTNPIMDSSEIVGIEFLTKNNKKCIAIIYKQTGSNYTNNSIINPQSDIVQGLWFYDLENQTELDCTANLSDDWSSYLCNFSTASNATYETYFNNLFEAVTNCLPDELSVDEITSLLQNIQSQSRSNQYFEYKQGNKIYKLNAQNQAVEVQTR